MKKNRPAVLKKFLVNAKTKNIKYGERNPLSLDLLTKQIFIQKMYYIHYNPVEAGLSGYPEKYKYSSEKFYETGVDEFGFITYWRD